MLLFLVCLFLLFSYTTENYENIKKQQCSVLLLDSFPTIGNCRNFTNIKNKRHYKKIRFNKSNYLEINTN